jgi:SAM-dependent methyltransferase
VKSITQYGATPPQGSSSLFAEGRYVPALDSLRVELNRCRAESSPAEWRAFCAETFSAESVHRYPLLRLIKEGPLGSGSGLIHNPLILDVIYDLNGVPGLLTPPANALRSWELHLDFCASLRARHFLFARELADLAKTVKAPRVLALGCGHLREGAIALTSDSMRASEIVAFDRDRACIDLIEREYDHPGLVTVSGSLRDFLNDSNKGKFDFIYVPTLLDKLEDSKAAVLLNALLGSLQPGGRLLAANFAPDLKDAAYLEACLDWWPFYRTEEELAALLETKSTQNLRGQAIFRDDSEGSVFLDLQSV